MRRASIFLAALLLLAGGWMMYDFITDRAPPHRFVLKLDEPAKLARLTLGNSEGDETTSMRGGPVEFTASRTIGDAHGAIRVEWPDGSATECVIGYITNGETEPHLVEITARNCPEIGAHVQL